MVLSVLPTTLLRLAAGAAAWSLVLVPARAAAVADGHLDAERAPLRATHGAAAPGGLAQDGDSARKGQGGSGDEKRGQKGGDEGGEQGDDEKGQDPYVPFFRALTIEEAMALAAEEEKLVMMVWVQEDETESKRLDRTTWQDRGVREFVSGVAVPVRIVGQENLPAGVRFEVSTYPTTIFYRPGEGEIDRIRGYESPSSFIIAARALLAGKSKEVARPEGDAATDPFAWLAWANHAYAAGDHTREATQAYDWLLDYGERFHPGFLRAYADFAIKRLLEICKVTRIARDSVRDRRAVLEERLRSGEASADDLWLYVRLNLWDQKEYMTLDMYDELAKLGPERQPYRDALFPHLLHRMVGHKRYSDVAAAVGGDVLGHLRARIEAFQNAEEATFAAAGEDGPSLDELSDLRDERVRLVLDGGEFYETLLGLGRGADAEKLIELYAAFNPTGRTFNVFVNHASRLELNELALRVGIASLERCGENGRNMLLRSMNRIAAADPDAAAAAGYERQPLRRGAVEEEDEGFGDGPGDGPDDESGDGEGSDGSGGGGR